MRLISFTTHYGSTEKIEWQPEAKERVASEYWYTYTDHWRLNDGSEFLPVTKAEMEKEKRRDIAWICGLSRDLRTYADSRVHVCINGQAHDYFNQYCCMPRGNWDDMLSPMHMDGDSCTVTDEATGETVFQLISHGMHGIPPLSENATAELELRFDLIIGDTVINMSGWFDFSFFHNNVKIGSYCDMPKEIWEAFRSSGNAQYPSAVFDDLSDYYFDRDNDQFPHACIEFSDTIPREWIHAALLCAHLIFEKINSPITDDEEIDESKRIDF